MEGRFAEEEVEERGVVGLDYKEEDLFDRNPEEGKSQRGRRRVGPYSVANEERIPRCGRGHSDLIVSTLMPCPPFWPRSAYEDQEGDSIDAQTGAQRVVAAGKGQCRWNRVFEVSRAASAVEKGVWSRAQTPRHNHSPSLGSHHIDWTKCITRYGMIGRTMRTRSSLSGVVKWNRFHRFLLQESRRIGIDAIHRQFDSLLSCSGDCAVVRSWVAHSCCEGTVRVRCPNALDLAWLLRVRA